MQVVSLSTGPARIREALETLEIAWSETKDEWDDASSRNFEENHVQPIGPKVRQAMDAISRLRDAVARVGRDCEP